MAKFKETFVVRVGILGMANEGIQTEEIEIDTDEPVHDVMSRIGSAVFDASLRASSEASPHIISYLAGRTKDVLDGEDE